MQYLAQDLSSSGLPERKEKPEQIPTDQLEPQDQPPVVTTEKPHSGRRRQKHPAAEGEDQRAEKKAKVAEDVEVLNTGLAEGESSALFVPDFECSDGHVITVGDSLQESPLLAMTLLKGLALPKDMENLPTGKAKNMAELCLFLAKVWTSTLKNSNNCPFQVLTFSRCRPGSVPAKLSATWMSSLRPRGLLGGICRR